MTARTLHPNIFEQPFVYDESAFFCCKVLNPIGAQPSEVLESGIRRELFERSECLLPPLLQ
jgi:hypothetical protein